MVWSSGHQRQSSMNTTRRACRLLDSVLCVHSPSAVHPLSSRLPKAEPQSPLLPHTHTLARLTSLVHSRGSQWSASRWSALSNPYVCSVT